MRTLRKACVAVATGLLLTACAASGPQSPSTAPAASVPASPAPVAKISASTKLPKNFRRLTKDGQDYICRREVATGSRTEIVETCLTMAEYEERARKGQDFLQGISGEGLPAPQPSGKTFTPGF